MRWFKRRSKRQSVPPGEPCIVCGESSGFVGPISHVCIRCAMSIPLHPVGQDDPITVSYSYVRVP